MPIILLPEVLRNKLGDDGAQALVDVINSSISKANRAWNESVTERLGRRLTEVKSDLELKIAGLDSKMQSMRADLLRWMFVFWASQVGITIALFTAFRH